MENPQALSQLSKQIIDSAQEGIIVYGPDLCYLLWNPFMEQLSGLSSDDVIGRHPLEVFPFLKEVGVIERLEKVSSGEAVPAIEFPYDFPKLGKSGWTSDTSSPLLNDEGKIIGVIGIVRDITAQKNAERMLQKSHERFYRLAENSQDMIYRMSLPDGLYEYVSPAAEKIFGYSPEEFYRSPFLIKHAIHPDWQDYLDVQWQKLLAGDMPPIYEYQINHKSGETRWLNQRNVLIKDDSGTPVYLEGTVTDITAQKLSEQALHDSEERLSLLAEQNKTISWEVDSQGLYTFISQVSETVIGYHSDELLGKKHFYDIHPEEGRETFKKAALEIFNKEAAFKNMENTIQAKDGRLVWVSTNGLPILNTDGTLKGYRGSDTDITERKLAEKALHDSEAKLKSILLSAPIGIGQVTNREFNFVTENFAQMLGYSVQELIGNKSRMTYPSDEEFERVGQYKYEEIKRKGTGSIETVMQKKDGTLINVFMSSTPVDQNDLSQGVTFTALDITERKTAEEALKYQQNLLEKAQELGQIGSWEYDPALDTFVGSEVGNQIYGIPNGYKAKYEMFLKRVHRDDREYFVETWETSLKSGFLDIEHRIVVNGITKWVREKAELEFDKNGNSVRGIGFTQDITERKQTEQALKNSEEHLRTVFEAADNVAFVTTDLNGADSLVKSFSPGAEKIFEYTAQEIIGQRVAILHPPEIKNDFSGVELALLSGEKGLSGETILVRKSGERFPALFTLSPLQDSSGELIGGVGVTIDITDRKQAEQERLDLETQLRQKYKMDSVGVMAGGMAHNFNNNLSIILGNVELSKIKMPPNPEIDGYLSNAKIAVLRSRDLIQQILTYSRQGIKDKTSIQLPLVMDETLQLLRATTPTTINLQQRISSDSHEITINADSSQIQECLINLCNNAMYAMEEEGDLTIALDRLELQQHDIPAQYDSRPGQYAKLSVQDNGSGMSAETVDKVFDLFFTTKPVDQGTGVGLSTVQGIVTQHGGLIKVNSSLGEGTTFELYFPVIAQAQATEAIFVSENMPGGTELILFVDDDPMLASLGEQMLRAKGYTVSTMTDSTEALKLFTANSDRFDLVITDQTMPDLTGKELIQKIKAIRADTPTIICTGFSSKVNEKTAKELGANAFLMKPLDMPKLLQTVRRVLDEKEK